MLIFLQLFVYLISFINIKYWFSIGYLSYLAVIGLLIVSNIKNKDKKGKIQIKARGERGQNKAATKDEIKKKKKTE